MFNNRIGKVFVCFFAALGGLMAKEQEVPEKFNWDEVIVMPQVEPHYWTGHQVINLCPFDKYYANKEEVKEFVEMHFSGAKPINTDAGHLRYCSDQVTVEGAYLEMGVCTGKTINFIAALNPEKVIYGFDSFEGLPSDWDRPDISVPAKTFAFKNPQMLPAVLHNVRLIKGMFEETLPKFQEQYLKNTLIAFIHIDCDIYESTKTIFDTLGDKLIPGSVIVFDEYYNYVGYERHEYKAFQEFLQKTGKRAKPLAFNQYYEQASFVIIE